MYTIKNFQISEITCDDNGSYKDSNTVQKRKYYVHIDENDDVFVRGVHQINGRYYYKERKRKAILRYRGPYGKYLHTRSFTTELTNQLSS